MDVTADDERPGTSWSSSSLGRRRRSSWAPVSVIVGEPARACAPHTGTWVDHVAGLAAMGYGPPVPVTLELDVHVYEQVPGEGTVHVVGRLLKAGRSVVVCGVDITDQGGRPVAIGTASFMAAPDPGLQLPSTISLDATTITPGSLRRPFAERAGCRRAEPGVAMLHRSEDGLNAAGTVNGGLIALVVEEPTCL